MNSKEALQQLYAYSLFASDELGEDIGTRKYADIVSKDLEILEILSQYKSSLEWCIKTNKILPSKKDYNKLMRWIHNEKRS